MNTYNNFQNVKKITKNKSVRVLWASGKNGNQNHLSSIRLKIFKKCEPILKNTAVNLQNKSMYKSNKFNF